MHTLAVVGAVANVQLLVYAKEDLRGHTKGHRSASAVLSRLTACTPQKQENVVVQCILLHSFGNMYYLNRHVYTKASSSLPSRLAPCCMWPSIHHLDRHT